MPKPKPKHKHSDYDHKSHWHLQPCDESSDDHCKCDDEDEDHNNHHENCVREVLKAILHAQRKVKKHKERDLLCCNEIIHELLEEKEETKKPKKNTIPFILYCACEPFKATGVTEHTTASKKKIFVCISTFIFKIIEINDHCAVLELLTFKNNKNCPSSSHHHLEGHDNFSVCSQVDHKDVDDLIGTGICITVDLNCFCAISCLPAVSL